MKNRTYLTVLFALLAVTAPALPAQGVAASKTPKPQTETKPQAETKLTGKTFLCDWGPYRVRFEFLSETQLKWEYLKAPPKEVGVNEIVTLDRHDIRPNLVLMAWSQKDGTEVVDVLDLEKLEIHINFFDPGKKRTSVVLKLTDATK